MDQNASRERHPGTAGPRAGSETDRYLFEAIPDALAVIDRHGTVIDCNRAAAELLGRTRQTLRCADFFSFLAEPSDTRHFHTLFGENGRLQNLAVQLRGAGQEPIDVLLSAVVTAPTEGARRTCLCIFRDNRCHLEDIERLNQEAQHFRSLSENAPDIIYTLDWNGAISYVNPAWQRILGHPPEEVIGHFFTDFVPPEEAAPYRHLYRQIRDEKKTIRDLSGILIAKDGRRHPFSMSGSPHFDANGNLTGMVGLFRDIAERRQVEQELKVQKAYAESLIENAPEAIVVLSNTDQVMRINREFTRLFGYPPSKAQGRPINDLILPPHLLAEGQALTRRAARGERLEVESVRKCMDGRLVDVSILATPIRIEGGQIGIYAIYRDITARKKAEAALQASEERHRTVLEVSPDPIIVSDVEHRVLYFNPAFTQVFGWELEACLGKPMDFVPEDDRRQTETLQSKLKRGESFYRVAARRLSKAGRVVDVSISGTAFRGPDGRPSGSVETLQDISERKRKEKEIHFMAYHDPLTRLPNRKSFYLRMNDILRQTRRSKGGMTWALMFLDLDKFKQVNDTLGHGMGDQLLKAVAVRIQKCLRESDYFFRLGGDEFTIILTNLSRDIDVARVAQKIGERVAQSFTIDGHEIYTATSIGICVFPNDGDDVEVLVKKADMAMYSAKEDRRGYRFFTEEMNSKAMARMHLESSLRRALDHEELYLHYQPLVDTRRRIIGMEALLRWRNADLGLVRTDEFISVAEETGTILTIGRWVLETACRQAKAFHDQGFSHLFVAVNLSPRQFQQADLVKMTLEILAQTQLPPSRLRFEVTESGVMEDPEKCIAAMRSLRAKGVRFAVDDFGTGYSSLSHLKRLPIDALKIDRSFIADAPDNQDDQEIIRTIISMAQNLGIDIVAEGVENETQLAFLTRHGCTLMQGYLFGKPLSPQAFEKLLQAAEKS